MHYLDDFLFIGTPRMQEVSKEALLVSDVFHDLDVPVAIRKTESPSTCMTFLGILVDTVTF